VRTDGQQSSNSDSSLIRSRYDLTVKDKAGKAATGIREEEIYVANPLIFSTTCWNIPVAAQQLRSKVNSAGDPRQNILRFDSASARSVASTHNI
jgi:hypothetical protein